jgi:ketosteroid isomerase-like protein
MSGRADVERLIVDLHAARVRGDLPAMCRSFADRGVFRIAGSSEGKPVAVTADGLEHFRPWLAMMVKAFRVTEYERLSLVIEGARCSAHWQATIHSKITGTSVATELVDLVEVRAGLIATYTEFFVPR